jgi:protein tyrosine phosphatase
MCWAKPLVRPHLRTAVDHSLLAGPYLNASLIPPFPCDDCPSRRSYIASQAPLPHTLPTFYDTLIDNEVPVVVNLSAFTEHGRVKADQYWPVKKGEVWDSAPGYRIEHREDPVRIGGQTADLCQAAKYRLRLTRGKDSKQLDFDLLHITSWPDFGAFSPVVFTNLLDMIEGAGKGQRGPVWIHCSAGIGRSGTVIASLLARDLGSSLLKAVQCGSVATPTLLVEAAAQAAEKMVDHERRFRPKMVQTADQLGMIASVIGDFLQQKGDQRE